MKKIFAIIFCLCDLLVFSQTPSIIEVRQIRLKALEVFKSYTDKIEVLNPYSDNIDFSKLFNYETQIYNDILYDNQPQLLDPKEYFSKIRKDIVLTSKITKWELGFPHKIGNKWVVTVKFEKEIKIKFNNCKDLEYPPKIFEYEMIIEMDKNLNYQENPNVEVNDIEDKIPFINAKISGLTVKNPINYFCIVKLNDISLLKSEYKNKINKSPDSYQIVELERNISNLKDELFVNNYDDDYRIIEIQDNCNAKSYDFNIIALKNIIGVNFSYTPLQFGIMNNDYPNLNLKTYNTGISLVFKRLLGKTMRKIKWYFNLNPGYSLDVFNFKGSHNTDFQSIDVDNDQYLRKINFSNISEKDMFHNIDIPISFGLMKTTKGFSFTMDLGVWTNFTVLQTHKSSLNAYYSGFYEQYCNLEISENGYYDFGKFSLSKKENGQLNLNSNNLNFGTFCSLGAMFKLKNYWYVATNFEYRYGFADRSNYNENFVKQFSKDEYQPFFLTINSWKTNLIKINVAMLKKF